MGDGTKFQCSSASRKFLNASSKRPLPRKPLRFSALQRAENSSIKSTKALDETTGAFQCSSASRKFLNRLPTPPVASPRRVSVLFSEPKIPQ